MTSPQADRADGYERPFRERFAHSVPTIRHFTAVVALCLVIASLGQAVQAHNADEFVFTAFALAFAAAAFWILRDGFTAGSWMIFPIALIAKNSGDSTGLWWVAIPSALAALAALLLVDRHHYRATDHDDA